MQRLGGEGQPKEMAWSLTQAPIGAMPRGQELISRVSGWTTWYGVAGGIARKADGGQARAFQSLYFFLLATGSQCQHSQRDSDTLGLHFREVVSRADAEKEQEGQNQSPVVVWVRDDKGVSPEAELNPWVGHPSWQNNQRASPHHVIEEPGVEDPHGGTRSV